MKENLRDGSLSALGEKLAILDDVSTKTVTNIHFFLEKAKSAGARQMRHAPAVEAVLASAQAVKRYRYRPQCLGSAICVPAFRLTDAASEGPICGTQLLQYVVLILSSDNDAAQVRLVLPSTEAPVISRDALCSPAIC